MFPSLNLFPSLSHLRARALLSSFCELTRTFSVTQTHSVTFIPSKYIYNHGDGEDEREHLPQVRTKSIFFPSQSVKKALSLVPGRAHQSLSKTLGSEREEKSKLLGPELFSFSKERFIFNQKKDKSLFSWRGGCAPLLSFFSFVLRVSSSSRRPLFCVLNKQLTYYVFVSSFIKQLKTQVIIVRQPPRSPVLTEPATIERVFRPLDAGRG